MIGKYFQIQVYIKYGKILKLMIFVKHINLITYLNKKIYNNINLDMIIKRQVILYQLNMLILFKINSYAQKDKVMS